MCRRVKCSWELKHVLIFSAARHTDGDKVIVAAMPEPAKVKEDPAVDINEREIIPSM